MSIIGLRGALVRLVPPDRSLHLENALLWMNDPDVSRTLKLNLGATRADEERFFGHVERRTGEQFFWAIVASETERHVGFIDLKGINWRQRSSGGGLVIGDRSVWGAGYATDAVRVRTRFAFEQLGLHRIEGHTINPAMRKVYEKCGYQYEGMLREKFWSDGRWHDSAVYAILEKDYFAAVANRDAGTISK